jgi:mRNA interferase RelE/StbE
LNVGFRNSFARDLRRIRDQELLSRVQQVIEQVVGAGGLGEIAHVKKLKGSEGYYHIRVSNYRIGL